MSVETLRTAIAVRAAELRGALLLPVGVTHHSRRKGNWRHCPCSWCAKKREATARIASPPCITGILVENYRDAWRADQRKKYRAALAELEQE